MLHLLKDREYRCFWLAQLFSGLGDGVTRMAIVYLVATLTDNPLAIGAVLFLQMLPTAVFGLFMGPLADRLPKQRLMIAADLYRMAVVLLMIPCYRSLVSSIRIS